MFSNRKIILIIILLVTGSIAAYVLLVIIPRHLAEQTYDGARQIGRDLKEVFQFNPQIKVNQVVVLQQQSDVHELATLSQKFQHRYTWRNTLMHSTKEIKVTGTFDAKAGFDLKEKFTITIEDGKALVVFPEPKLLSIEMLGDLEFKDENGIWNWINEEDRSTAINAFTRDAKRYATSADFINDASKKLEASLIPILKNHVKEITITIGDRTTYTWKESEINTKG